MQKRSKTKISPADRQEINDLISSMDKFDDLDSPSKDRMIKQVKKYLTIIVDLSFDIEHSKISLSKLQKLFGFSLTHAAKSKEV